MKCTILFFVFISALATAQKTATNQAETSGTCSPVVQGNQGKVVFTCKTAIDEATRKKVLSLLNAILKSTADADATNKKLDDILRYVAQLQPDITQGSGSIAQVGGAGNTATVNNFAPPARRIANQQAFIECLKARPGKFSVSAVMNNSEAYHYAKDWHDVLTAAGWQITHTDVPVQIVMIGGSMWAGTRIGMHGIVDGTDQLLDDSPEKNFYGCLSSVPIGARNLQLISNSKAHSGIIDIMVSDHE